jgi:hypothetical protein
MLDEVDAWRRGAVLSADEVIAGDDVCHAEAFDEGDKVGHTYTGTMFFVEPRVQSPAADEASSFLGLQQPLLVS